MSEHAREHARVDHDICAGASQCALKAPRAFQLDDDGLSVFDPYGDWTDAELTSAVDACPMAAIELLTESESD